MEFTKGVDLIPCLDWRDPLFLQSTCRRERKSLCRKMTVGKQLSPKDLCPSSSTLEKPWHQLIKLQVYTQYNQVVLLYFYSHKLFSSLVMCLLYLLENAGRVNHRRLLSQCKAGHTCLDFVFNCPTSSSSAGGEYLLLWHCLSQPKGWLKAAPPGALIGPLIWWSYWMSS